MLRLYIRSGKLLGMYLEWTLIQLLKPEGDWACLCVQVDVDKPLINTVLIGRFEQAVTYEGIHDVFLVWKDGSPAGELPIHH